MKNRIYTSLVTGKPAKEKPGEELKASLQEISSARPELFVPQGENPLAERERMLLLYDAAITPVDMPGAFGIEPWALDTARLVRAKQVAEQYSGPLPEVNLTDKQKRQLGELLMPYVSSGARNQQKAAQVRLEIGSGYVFNDTHDLTKVPLESWDDVVDYARTLLEEAEKQGEKPVPAPSQGNGEGDEGEESDEEGSYDGPPSPSYSEERGKPDDSPRKYLGDPWSPSFVPKPGTGGIREGKLYNADRPDTLPMKSARKRGMRKRSELEGSVPSKWDRLTLDGKVFKGAPIRGGSKGRGTILVDMSSSMSWSRQDFQVLLDAVPECTVFGYCGNGPGGRMVLLGDRGRVADLNAVENWKGNTGGGNIVDIPCLEILAKMPKPRIWLSDAGATGRNDNRTSYIIERVAEICERGNIVRIRTAKAASEYILTGKCSGPFQPHIGANATHTSYV